MEWSGGQYSDHLTYSYLEFHQDADHARDITKTRSIYIKLHTPIGVSIS